jgi:hypothetical protein
MMIRRLVFVFAIVVSSPLRAEIADTIRPGVQLSAADATLHKFGCRIDEKFQLDELPRDKNHRLAYSQLDDATTLVLAYQLSTGQIDSVSVSIIPEYKPKALRKQVDLTVLEVKFEEGGIYSLKLKRRTMKESASAGSSSGPAEGSTK